MYDLLLTPGVKGLKGVPKKLSRKKVLEKHSLQSSCSAYLQTFQVPKFA